MELAKLQRVVVDALEDVKAQNIKVYNTVGLSDMFDRVVLASGTSNRQTRALAYRVAQQVKEAGGHVVSVEGADAGEWVLVDLGDLVVHVMQPAIRDYYGLEEIWGGKPVRMRLAESGAKRAAARTAGDGDEGADAAPGAIAASKTARARKQPAAKAGRKPRAAAPARTPAKRPAKSASRKTAAKKPATRAARKGTRASRAGAAGKPSRARRSQRGG